MPAVKLFRKNLEFLYPWLFLIFFLITWELVVRHFKIQTYILPSPLVIIKKGIEIRGYLGYHFLVTLKEVLMGFVLGSLIGATLAFLISYFRVLKLIFMPFIVAFQTMPKLGLAPLFIIWFGFTFFTNIAICAALSFFPVLINFFAGLDQIDEDEERLMASYNASKNQIFFHVRFFKSLPFLFTGLQLSIVLSVSGAVVAEFVAGDAGLAYLTILANSNLETPMMFCALILLGCIGFSLFQMSTFLKKIMMPWSIKTATITSEGEGL